MIHLRKALQILLVVLVILYAAAAHAAPIRTVTATITRITDGDTVQAITPEGTKLKVRLYGIDAPETSKGKIPGEPFGNDSRNYPGVSGQPADPSGWRSATSTATAGWSPSSGWRSGM